MTAISQHNICAITVVFVVAQLVIQAACYTPDMRDDCFLLCGMTPNSVKCFRCKNRLPMRFGKRGGVMLGNVPAAPEFYFGSPSDGLLDLSEDDYPVNGSPLVVDVVRDSAGPEDSANRDPNDV